jgi:hypothetical protein
VSYLCAWIGRREGAEGLRSEVWYAIVTQLIATLETYVTSLVGKSAAKWSKQDLAKRTELRSDLDCVEEHRTEASHAHTQRKQQVSSLASKKAIVLFDFKENIKFNSSRSQSSHEFYETRQRTVFGAVAYHRTDDGEIAKVYIDMISENLTHDAYAVCFYVAVLDHSFFKRVGSRAGVDRRRHALSHPSSGSRVL